MKRHALHERALTDLKAPARAVIGSPVTQYLSALNFGTNMSGRRMKDCDPMKQRFRLPVVSAEMCSQSKPNLPSEHKFETNVRHLDSLYM